MNTPAVKLQNIKLIALDIDGVALPDTFSPIIYSFIKRWNGQYTREIERNIFSQNRMQAAIFLIKHFNLKDTPEKLIQDYFQERENYLKNHIHGPVEGLAEFLELVRSLNVQIVCYGGLSKDHFESHLREFLHYFDDHQYICTNEFRPGIKEIVKDYYSLDYESVLFIDDVNKVAEEAKRLNVPFIGVPSGFEYGFQREDMIKTGVKYLVKSVKNINYPLLNQIDRDISAGNLWNK